MIRLIPLTVIFILFSCQNENELNKISEGIIEYDITYASDSASTIPIQFLPKKMILKFNQNYASYRIEDVMGMCCITNTTNIARRTHLSTVKFLNKKYRYEGKQEEVPVFFRPESFFLVKQTDDITNLAGVPCNKSIVTDLKDKRKFEIAYTDEFFVKNPNINTPYSDINGILMKFDIDLGKMRLTLTAKKIVPVKVSNKAFYVSKDYKTINQQKMREIIDSMLR